MVKTVLLVDLSNVFWTSWYAGVNKAARWPFDDTMSRVRTEARKYTHCGIMTDGERSFRNDLDSRWKKNREEKHAGGVAMLAEVERALDAEGFHVFKVAELEADDLTATAVRQLLEWQRAAASVDIQNKDLAIFADGLEITINSSDRDLLGLLEPGVQILAVNKPRIVRAEDVRPNKKFGVDPPKIRDFLVLSDAHNGVKYFEGIGPVHAARLLNEYGDLQGILTSVDSITPPSIQASIRKAMAGLVDDRPLIDVAVQIVTLRADAPIDATEIFYKKEPRPAGVSWDDQEEDRNRNSGEQGRPGSGPPGDAESGESDLRDNASGSVAQRQLSDSGRDIQNAGARAQSGAAVGGDSGVASGLGSTAVPGARSEGVSSEPHASTEPTGHPSSVLPGTGSASREMVLEPMGGDESSGGRARPMATVSTGDIGEGTEPRKQGAPIILAPRWELGLEPTTPREAYRLAETAHRAGFWPKHGSVEGHMMIILAGRARGLAAFDALNGMHIIEGKPVFGAYLLIGMVQRAKECAYFELVESDQSHAIWITKRKGGKTEQRRVYTIDDARRAELVRPRSNWERHPEDMCVKTAGAKLTRAAWAYITSGAVAAEEMGYE